MTEPTHESCGRRWCDDVTGHLCDAAQSKGTRKITSHVETKFQSLFSYLNLSMWFKKKGNEIATASSGKFCHSSSHSFLSFILSSSVVSCFYRILKQPWEFFFKVIIWVSFLPVFQ